MDFKISLSSLDSRRQWHSTQFLFLFVPADLLQLFVQQKYEALLSSCVDRGIVGAQRLRFLVGVPSTQAATADLYFHECIDGRCNDNDVFQEI